MAGAASLVHRLTTSDAVTVTAAPLVARESAAEFTLSADFAAASSFMDLVNAWSAGRRLPGEAPSASLRFEFPEDRRLKVAIADEAGMPGPPAGPAWSERLPRLLESMLDRPRAAVSELPMLGPDEASLWLDALRGPNLAVVEPPVPDLVVAAARANPIAAAVRHGAEQLDYGSLEVASARLAAWLVWRGTRPGMRVSLVMPRSRALVIAALGVMRAGAVYVPVDPAQPPERVRLMVDDSRSHLVLTEGATSDPPAYFGVDAVPLYSLLRELGDAPNQPALPQITPDWPTYMIYTSGSTGTPKATVLTHRTLLNYVCWHRDRYEVTAADRMAMVVSPSFDVSVAELWPALITGAALEVVEDEQRLDPKALWRWLDERRTTLMFVPTPLAEAFLAEGSSPRALRHLILGGDRLRRRPREGCSFEVSNVYGPAEATIGATEGLVEPAAAGRGLPDIGRALTNVRTYVLDRGANLLPPGFPGELYVGGAGVGNGYFRRPSLSAEKFLPDPFSGEPGARMYRTGDLAVYAPDGALQCLGRLDHQVEIRGHRVELGEIEAQIQRRFTFSQAVVLLSEGPAGEPRLLLYAAPKSAAVTGPQLRRALTAHLPDYMIPTAAVMLDRLPLNSSGKIDRNVLASLPIEPLPCGPERLTTGLEEVVLNVWRDVLKLDAIGLDDDFYELGGHSLLVAEVADKLAAEVGADVPLRLLLENVTPGRLAAAMAAFDDA
jgi:amino acid adenylation domain-containing protein